MIVTVDTGGTKTLISSFTKAGKVGKQIVYPTPHDPIKYTQLLRQTLEAEYGNKKVDIIVIALPGIIDQGIARWCRNLGCAARRGVARSRELAPATQPPLLCFVA